MGRTATTVVVGGGCSGALAAIHLHQPTIIIDPGPSHELGRGAAYRTNDPAHLLNSRAAAMSALADRPGDFVDWCREQGLDIGPADFAPRTVYGDYVHDRLQRAEFTHVKGVAVRILQDASVLLRGGRHIRADRVILALGHGAPAGPLAITSAVRTHPYYVGNPWIPGALERVPGNAPVLLIGTGLTALDVALTLAGRGRRAPMLAVSRRGLVPQAHAERQIPADQPFAYPGAEIGGLLRAVRRYAGTQPDWRSAVDALRPQIDRLWWQLSVDARRRFLQHVATYWEAHRHRMAPAVAARVAGLRASGALRVQAGAIQSIRRSEGGCVVTMRGQETQTVGAIVNCTGPGGAAGSPLGRALLDDGLARRDPTGIGLDVDGLGRLLDRDGEPVEHLFAVGPTRRGAWWETTAVPEIRAQAQALGQHLLEHHHVLDERDQHVLDRAAVAGVAQHDRHVGVEVQGPADRVGAVLLHAVEAVDRDEERGAAPLEVVHRREAVGQPPGVRQHDRAEGAQGKLVPQEPEPVLPRGTEEIEDDLLVDADPAEVHGDRRGRLALDAVNIVDAEPRVGEYLLRLQRADFAHRADERGLADAKPTRDENLHRQGDVTVRALGGH